MAEDPIPPTLLSALKNTQFACSSLTRLDGGAANFTYRGHLLNPLPDRSPTVIVKHAEPYVATARNWVLDISRSDFEQTMLYALSTHSPTPSQNVHVTSPVLYHTIHSPTATTLILSDFTPSLELKAYLTTHSSSLSASSISRLGTALGAWARSFHAWGAAPEQTALRTKMRLSTGMRQLKVEINYGRLVPTVEMFPGILAGERELFESVETAMRSEVGEGMGREDLIHGDFWCGNVLLHDAPLPSATTPIALLVIDWEMSQLSSLAFDLGQMFAELYLLHHFRDIEAGLWMISAFMDGYGPLEDEELAFRVALHFGTHLVVWPCRVGGWGEGEVMERCVEVGREFIRHAWGEAKEREWFRGGPLHGVFFGSGG